MFCDTNTQTQKTPLSHLSGKYFVIHDIFYQCFALHSVQLGILSLTKHLPGNVVVFFFLPVGTIVTIFSNLCLKILARKIVLNFFVSLISFVSLMP